MTSDTAARAPAGGAPDARTETPAAAAKFTAPQIAIIVVAIIVTIGAARIAEPFLVPVVMGILFSYMLRPLVSLLERIHLPRAAAAALVIAVLVSVVGTTGYLMRDDVNGAVAELPVAARKLRQVVADGARQSPGPMTHMKAAAAELDRAAAEASGKPSAAPAPPVAGVSAQFQDFVTQQSGKALAVLSQIMVALLVAFFLLAAGDTFRRKVAKIAGFMRPCD